MTLVFLALISVCIAVPVLKYVKGVFDLVHPWRAHLPAAMLTFAAAELLTIMTLLGEWPMSHVNMQRPGPWDFANVVGFSVIVLGASIFIDELWARQEQRKSFNWFSLIDEGLIGFCVGKAFGAFIYQPTHYISTIPGVGESFGPWNPGPYALQWGLRLGAILVAVAFVLERRRPYVPGEEAPAPKDVSDFEADLTRRMEAGERVSYWETQNPPFVSWLVFAASAAMIVGAWQSWGKSPWISILSLAGAAAVFLFYGGIRVLVTREHVAVKLGLLGLKLLSLPVGEVAEAQMHKFSPLKDFGGYGIRFNREMKAYFLRGNTGVKITTRCGKKYLIGSDTPEKLEAAIRVSQGAM